MQVRMMTTVETQVELPAASSVGHVHPTSPLSDKVRGNTRYVQYRLYRGQTYDLPESLAANLTKAGQAVDAEPKR